MYSMDGDGEMVRVKGHDHTLSPSQEAGGQLGGLAILNNSHIYYEREVNLQCNACLGVPKQLI